MKKILIMSAMVLAIFITMNVFAEEPQPQTSCETPPCTPSPQSSYVGVDVNQKSTNSQWTGVSQSGNNGGVSNSQANPQLNFEQNFHGTDRSRMLTLPITPESELAKIPPAGPPAKAWHNMCPLDVLLGLGAVKVNDSLLKEWNASGNTWEEEWTGGGKVKVQVYPLLTGDRKPASSAQVMLASQFQADRFQFTLLDIVSVKGLEEATNNFQVIGAGSGVALRRGGTHYLVLSDAGDILYLLKGQGIGFGGGLGSLFGQAVASILSVNPSWSKATGETPVRPYQWAAVVKVTGEKPAPPQPPPEDVGKLKAELDASKKQAEELSKQLQARKEAEKPPAAKPKDCSYKPKPARPEPDRLEILRRNAW